MPNLLFLLGFLPLLTLACYDQYTSVFDGQCVRVVLGSRKIDYEWAQKTCESDGAHLPIIRRRCNSKHILMKHGWGCGVTARMADTCNYSMINSVYLMRDGYWSRGITDMLTQSACQSPTRSWICDTYTLLQEDKNGDTCFLLSEKASAYPQAEAACNSQLAHVASIHDKTFNDYLKRTAIGYGITSVLIGLQVLNGKYEWSDGSETDYLNFAPGFPDPSYGECVEMDIIKWAGKWSNVDCSTPLRYMCTKPPGSYDDDVVPAGCSDGEFHPGIASPTWGAATGPASCQYSIVDPEKTKKVSVAFDQFESNSCCDSLTIYDGSVGNKVLITLAGYYGINAVNVTGSSNTITMVWNATSGAHVRGWHAKVGSV